MDDHKGGPRQGLPHEEVHQGLLDHDEVGSRNQDDCPQHRLRRRSKAHAVDVLQEPVREPGCYHDGEQEEEGDLRLSKLGGEGGEQDCRQGHHEDHDGRPVGLLDLLTLEGRPGEDHDDHNDGEEEQTEEQARVEETEGDDDRGEGPVGLDAYDVAQDGDDRGP